LTRRIVLTRVHGPAPPVLFDCATGRLEAAAPPPGRARGKLHQVDGHAFALYALDAHLYFQWGAQRWEPGDMACRPRYQHELARQRTAFALDGKALSYAAWWAGDPLFNKFIPERDQEEDYLGYVFALWTDRDLQRALIAAWSGA
jgi:hypothetical protein